MNTLLIMQILSTIALIAITLVLIAVTGYTITRIRLNTRLIKEGYSTFKWEDYTQYKTFIKDLKDERRILLLYVIVLLLSLFPVALLAVLTILT